jgi:hypothetical protein
MIPKPTQASRLPIVADPHAILPRSLKRRDALLQEKHDCIMNDYFKMCQPFPLTHKPIAPYTAPLKETCYHEKTHGIGTIGLVNGDITSLCYNHERYL